MAKVLELQLQHSVLLVNIQGWFPLELNGWISLKSKGFSRVFSSTKTSNQNFEFSRIQEHQFFRTQTSLWTNSHIYAWQVGSIYFYMFSHLLHQIIVKGYENYMFYSVWNLVSSKTLNAVLNFFSHSLSNMSIGTNF